MPMHFEERGNKNAPTIVFMHGGGISGWMWQKQWEAFLDFHMLIPDLPEHGGSMADGLISIKGCAEQMAGFIRGHASGGRAHVVGHSLGGKIAVQLLSTHPEVVDHAIVASAIFRPIPLFKLFFNMPVYKLTVWMMKSKGIMDMQAKQMNFPNEYYRENFMKDSAAYTPKMLSRIYAEMNRHIKLPSGLEKSHVPTLVLAGEKELKAMRLSVCDIANALPNSRGFLVKEGRHTFTWENSEVFNDAIRSWITDKKIENPSLLPV